MSSLTNLIDNNIQPLHLSDTIQHALDMLMEQAMMHLPVINQENNEFITLISESYLLDAESDELTINDLIALPRVQGLLLNAHPYDALKIMSQEKWQIVPIVDADNHYLGVVSQSNMIQYVAENGGWLESGGIIVFEIKPGSYSLSEIARICEGEGVIIYNSRVYFNPETSMLEVTIKTNKSYLQNLVATFERFDYVIKEVYGKMPMEDEMMDRYKLLMNYLDM